MAEMKCTALGAVASCMRAWMMEEVLYIPGAEQSSSDNATHNPLQILATGGGTGTPLSVTRELYSQRLEFMYILLSVAQLL
jgi:hypothetical protein